MATGRIPDPNSAPITAKGDLYTYSTVPARLAVGNNGETLVADSSTTTGLRYTPGTVQSNPIINSAMQNWQRGTSFSLAASASNTYTADRFSVLTYANQATTISRQTTSDTTNLPNIQYALRFQRNSGQTGVSTMQLAQTLETVNSIPFAGKTVTVSYYARAGADYSPTSKILGGFLATGTGTDQSIFAPFTGVSYSITANATLTTTWQRFTFTGTVPTTATQLAVLFNFTPTGTASTNDYFEITGLQMDIGSVALPFRTYAGTLQGELAACQRYYTRLDGSAYTTFGAGRSNSATAGHIAVNLPVPMRTTPTAGFSTASGFIIWTGAGATTALTAIGLNQGSKTALLVDITTAASQTVGYGTILFANNSATTFIEASAEL